MEDFVKRTVDVAIEDDIDFESLLLSPKVLSGLKAIGFDRPSPIQLQSIPLAKCGADLVCQAKSGTGKTCVFAVTALESVNLSFVKLQVLVLAPTREIAHQIHNVITAIGQEMKSLKCSLFIGGMPMQHDVENAKLCHIAIGTPGRIKALVESKAMLTKSIRLFVLDEADKLLEEGSFQEQINWIYSTLPKHKQVLALSATYPQHLAEYLSNYMNDPIHIRISTDDLNLKGVRQMFVAVKYHALPNLLYNEKCEALQRCIENIPFQQCMVFSNYQSRASHLCTLLNKKGWPCTFIAGGQLQPVRLKAITELKSYNCRVLITTDLSARGIDCDKVNLVINLDMPWDTETYLHRVGRAGRFGTYGLAISIVSGADEVQKLADVSESINCDIVQLPDDLSQICNINDGVTDGKTIKIKSVELRSNNKPNFNADKPKRNGYHLSCLAKNLGIGTDYNSNEKCLPEERTTCDLNPVCEKSFVKCNDATLDDDVLSKELIDQHSVPILLGNNILEDSISISEKLTTPHITEANSISKILVESDKLSDTLCEKSSVTPSHIDIFSFVEEVKIINEESKDESRNKVKSEMGCVVKKTLPKYLSLFSKQTKKELTVDSVEHKGSTVDPAEQKENNFVLTGVSDAKSNVIVCETVAPSKNNSAICAPLVSGKVKQKLEAVPKFNPMGTCFNLMEFSTFSEIEENNQSTENRVLFKHGKESEQDESVAVSNYDRYYFDVSDVESECFEYNAPPHSDIIDHNRIDKDRKISKTWRNSADHSNNFTDSFSSSSENESKISVESGDSSNYTSEISDNESNMRVNQLTFPSEIYDNYSGVQHLNCAVTKDSNSFQLKPWNQLRFVESFGQAYLKHISEIKLYQKIYEQELKLQTSFIKR